jgi:hypothetical protein
VWILPEEHDYDAVVVMTDVVIPAQCSTCHAASTGTRSRTPMSNSSEAAAGPAFVGACLRALANLLSFWRLAHVTFDMDPSAILYRSSMMTAGPRTLGRGLADGQIVKTQE